MTLAAITYHCGQCEWVGFGMLQRGASDCHGNRLTDSAATVWVSIVSVGGCMADSRRRGVCKAIRKALSGTIILQIQQHLLEQVENHIYGLLILFY